MVLLDAVQFVDREDELVFFDSLIKSVYSDPNIPPRKRVVHLVGTSSIGKSTLLKKFEHYLNQEFPDSCSILLSFEHYANLPVEPFKRRVLSSFEAQIATCLGINPIAEPDINEHKVSRHVEELQKNKIVVFLIDEANTLSNKTNLVSAFEDILEQCLYLPRVIFIIAGRHIIAGWKNIDLRPYANINLRTLPPFDYFNTEKQIHARVNSHFDKNISDDFIRRIYEISGGSPGNNQSILEYALNDPDKFDDAEALHICNLKLYDAVRERKHELQESEVTELLPALEALCVLQDFVVDQEIPIMFAAHKNLNGVWDKDRTLSMFSVLSSIQIGPGPLIDWDPNKDAFAMEDHFRANLEKELKLSSTELWMELQNAAVKMYDEWAASYASVIFAEKASFHKARLNNHNSQFIGGEM